EQEARENMALVEKHLASEETENMVEGQEHVVNDSSIPRNDEHNIPGTMEKGKNVEESRITPLPTPIRSPRIHIDLVSSDTEKLHELTVPHTTPSSISPSTKAKFMPRKSFVTLADHLYKAMVDSLPTMVDKHIKEQVKKQVPETPSVRPRDQDDPHDDAHPKGEKDNKQEQGPSTSANQEQADDYDFWTDSYASDDGEIPTKQVSQDIMEEVSLNVDEAKLKKIIDEMLRQRCTSGDKHQYHIDQMKNFLKTPTLSLINQDLLYLKKGNSRPKKIVLSLYKFPTVVFNDDDIEERTSRWVNKKQKESKKPKEVIYSNSKIVKIIKTYWELGHKHKFITEIIARRANDCIVSITEPDFKNLNKNDIEDVYLLIMNRKVWMGYQLLGLEDDLLSNCESRIVLGGNYAHSMVLRPLKRAH
nr:hypothetical protein [Tanacetum cinerariifolium]